MMRRDFVTFLRGATAWAATARAQELQHLIGLLTGGEWAFSSPGCAGGLLSRSKNGFVEGKNIHIEFRETNGLLRSPTVVCRLLGRTAGPWRRSSLGHELKVHSEHFRSGLPETRPAQRSKRDATTA